MNSYPTLMQSSSSSISYKKWFSNLYWRKSPRISKIPRIAPITNLGTKIAITPTRTMAKRCSKSTATSSESRKSTTKRKK